MSRERMRWYCDALETAAAADGKFIVAPPTIHSDDDFAHQNGFPSIIADGMLSTNWISALLYTHFGISFLAQGELRTKFIRPVYEDEVLETHAVVIGIDGEGDDDERYSIEVWCQTATGEKCTVGSASVPVTPYQISEGTER